MKLVGIFLNHLSFLSILTSDLSSDLSSDSCLSLGRALALGKIICAARFTDHIPYCSVQYTVATARNFKFHNRDKHALKNRSNFCACWVTTKLKVDKLFGSLGELCTIL